MPVYQRPQFRARGFGRLNQQRYDFGNRLGISPGFFANPAQSHQRARAGAGLGGTIGVPRGALDRTLADYFKSAAFRSGPDFRGQLPELPAFNQGRGGSQAGNFYDAQGLQDYIRQFQSVQRGAVTGQVNERLGALGLPDIPGIGEGDLTNQQQATVNAALPFGGNRFFGIPTAGAEGSTLADRPGGRPRPATDYRDINIARGRTRSDGRPPVGPGRFDEGKGGIGGGLTTGDPRSGLGRQSAGLWDTIRKGIEYVVAPGTAIARELGGDDVAFGGPNDPLGGDGVFGGGGEGDRTIPSDLTRLRGYNVPNFGNAPSPFEQGDLGAYQGIYNSIPGLFSQLQGGYGQIAREGQLSTAELAHLNLMSNRLGQDILGQRDTELNRQQGAYNELGAGVTRQAINQLGGRAADNPRFAQMATNQIATSNLANRQASIADASRFYGGKVDALKAGNIDRMERNAQSRILGFQGLGQLLNQASGIVSDRVWDTSMENKFGWSPERRGNINAGLAELMHEFQMDQTRLRADLEQYLAEAEHDRENEFNPRDLIGLLPYV